MSIHARLVWAYLPCHADKEGRLRDKPFQLKLDILPLDDVNMDALLNEIAERGFILRYEADGRKYIQINRFLEYQNPHKREADSDIPPPEADPRPAQGQPKADPGEPKSDPGPTKAGTGRAVKDPVSDPEISLSGSDPDPDPPEANPGSRKEPPARSSERANPPTAHDWLQAFGAAWCQRRGRVAYGGGASDAKASAELGDLLSAMPVDERLRDWERREAMFAEFFATADKATLGAGCIFAFFVPRFRGLVSAPARASPAMAEKVRAMYQPLE